jgi:pyrimidine operon attenuation protein/uracil phosphoribosyltransferase
MPAGGEQAFIPDRRGNRLERHLFSVAPDGRSHRLYLRASPEVAAQFERFCPPGQNYLPVNAYVPGVEGWTHCLGAAGIPDARVGELADLLSEVLTLPRLSPIELAIALDWYKIPADDVESRDWRNTLDGSLVHMGKYWTSTPEAMARAGRMLVRRLVAAVHRHPALASANAVVAVPGHDSAYLSFGERLAANVAETLGVPLIKVTTRREFRPPAKELSGITGSALTEEFSVAESLTAATVLIVDDVLRTGQTMSAVAAAAIKADAARAYGLAGVRTLRS